jgi:CO dehydrogenase/acetyl-CoA synthase alpha subunit
MTSAPITDVCGRCGHGQSEHTGDKHRGTCTHDQGACGCNAFVTDPGPVESQTLNPDPNA